MLRMLGYEVCIGWVPAHVGVNGNESADRIAKAEATGDVFYGVPPRCFSLDWLVLAF
jgi:hypothetical protein